MELLALACAAVNIDAPLDHRRAAAEVLGDYVQEHDPVEIRWNDGHEWDRRPWIISAALKGKPWLVKGRTGKSGRRAEARRDSLWHQWPRAVAAVLLFSKWTRGPWPLAAQQKYEYEKRRQARQAAYEAARRDFSARGDFGLGELLRRHAQPTAAASPTPPRTTPAAAPGSRSR